MSDTRCKAEIHLYIYRLCGDNETVRDQITEKRRYVAKSWRITAFKCAERGKGARECEDWSEK